jgi:NhaP-type Na+/H+ or K+/H+ antiporter
MTTILTIVGGFSLGYFIGWLSRQLLRWLFQ